METENFLIIDGNSIMNRAFYGIKLLSTKDGIYTNAVYGFLNIYYMIMDMVHPNYVAVAFDISRPTFRHEMYAEYKAGRRSMPDELRPQMDLIKDILNAMNVKVLELEGFEADDILGTIASVNSKNDIFTYILTGDKDSLQLVSDKTSVIMPSTKMGKTEYTIYTPEVLKEKMGIAPYQVIELKSLMGDKSDNIPGVPKVGEKTAKSLLDMCSNLDNIYANIDNIDISESLRTRLKENREIAYLSHDLATINVNVPIDVDYNLLKLTDVNLPELSKIFTRLSFKKFLEKYIKEGQDINLETESSVNFYKDLTNTKFHIIDNIESLHNILDTDKIVFNYFEECNDNLDNSLLFKIQDNIYLIKLKQEDQKYVLNEFCSSKAIKLGYDIKKLLNLAILNGVTNINNFKEDVKIKYYLVDTNTNNFSIENIAYNILDINFPTIDDSAKEQVQTSLFDILDNTSNTKIELSDDEKKFVFAYLKSIEMASAKLDSKIHKLNLETLYYDLEMPLIETLANIEANGMYVDVEKLKAFGIIIDQKIASLTCKIHKLANEEFNINSSKELGKILFEKLELPVIKKTKTSYSTDKEVLEELQDKHEIIPLILEYRTFTKLKSTYVDGLIKEIATDGRIHTTFMQALTMTGRLSSTEPNLQNIPTRTEEGNKIRECFIAEKENTILIDADYSQIELRVLADMSNDINMIDAYNKGEDIHTVTASQVFNVDISEVTKEMRFKAKAVNFGIVYGISDFGLSKNISSTRLEAKEYIKNYFKHFYGVEKYVKELVEKATDSGVATTKFGRRRYVLELKSANRNTKMFGERIAMNMPIQGTAADIMKMAMNEVYRKFKANNLKSKIIMQVHDELIVEAYIDEKDLVKNIIKESMENIVKLKVPLVIDINEGKNWAEAK